MTISSSLGLSGVCFLCGNEWKFWNYLLTTVLGCDWLCEAFSWRMMIHQFGRGFVFLLYLRLKMSGCDLFLANHTGHVSLTIRWLSRTTCDVEKSGCEIWNCFFPFNGSIFARELYNAFNAWKENITILAYLTATTSRRSLKKWRWSSMTIVLCPKPEQIIIVLYDVPTIGYNLRTCKTVSTSYRIPLPTYLLSVYIIFIYSSSARETWMGTLIKKLKKARKALPSRKQKRDRPDTDAMISNNTLVIFRLMMCAFFMVAIVRPGYAPPKAPKLPEGVSRTVCLFHSNFWLIVLLVVYNICHS